MTTRRGASRRLVWGLWGALALSAAVALSTGAEPVSWDAAVHGIEPDSTILWLRVPRLVLVATVGAALGAAGCALQALVENPLADPFVLGLSGGAAVGVTAAVVAGQSLSGDWSAAATGPAFVTLCAALGALGAALLVFSLGKTEGRLDPTRLVLVGVVSNAFCSALVLAVQSVARPDTLQSLHAWLLGSGGYVPAPLLAAGVLATLTGLAVLVWRSRALDVLAHGELDAHALGLDVTAERRWVFGASAALVAAAVSLSGIVGFVGLLVPHGVRRLARPAGSHRTVLVGSALGGALLLLVADTVGRVAFRWVGTEPPLGMWTALLGAPAFLWLLTREARPR